MCDVFRIHIATVKLDLWTMKHLLDDIVLTSYWVFHATLDALGSWYKSCLVVRSYTIRILLSSTTASLVRLKQQDSTGH